MTAYRDFIQDFPARCFDILNMVNAEAEARDREVTLTLMVASAGFIVPFERLRPQEEAQHPHGNKNSFETHSQKLKELMNKPFLGSKLHPEQKTEWILGKQKSIDDQLESWPDLINNKLISNKKTAGNILKAIRNALAHGNLKIKGNPIDAIIFISTNIKADSKKIIDHTFIKVSPKEFSVFLKKWFLFLKENEIPPTVVQEVLHETI